MIDDSQVAAAALNNLGWLLQRSDPKRALSLLMLAWKLAPDSANVADTLGWLRCSKRMLLADWPYSTARTRYSPRTER